MSWTIVGYAYQKLSTKDKSPPVGFYPPAFKLRHADKPCLPLIHDERIVEMVECPMDGPYIRFQEDGKSILREGASIAMVGWPAVYGFVFNPDGYIYVSQRNLMMNNLKDWLDKKDFKNIPDEHLETMIEQARSFCDGNVPQHLIDLNRYLWDLSHSGLRAN